MDYIKYKFYKVKSLGKYTEFKSNKKIHLENNIEHTTEKIYKRFSKTHQKLLSDNHHGLNNLSNNTDRDTQFTIELATPLDNILD